MSSIIIRQADLNDLKQLAPLFNEYRKFYEQPDDIELAESFIMNRLLNHDSKILVASYGEQKLIGFCQLYPTYCSVIAAPICVLYDLFVEVSSRNTGAGKLLMLASHEYAKASRFSRLDLSTAKTNLAAQSLYESLGWVRDKVFYTYSKVI
jgi:ribosomal protein S18 acetylase RimI-like enzyme